MDSANILTDPMTEAEKAALFRENFDGFMNLLLRAGTDGGTVAEQAVPLTVTELENLYMTSPTARRIVDIYPEEMFRAGFTLKGVPDGFDMDALRSDWEDLDLDSKLIQFFTWSRLYGGAGLLLGTKTGAQFSEPMDTLEELDFVRVLGAPEMKSMIDVTVSPESALSGVPEVWNVKPLLGGSDFPVHNSRVLFDGGKPMPPAMRLTQKSDFGMSILQGLQDKIARYDIANKMANLILSRLQQGVWKSDGLGELCDNDAGFRTVQRRLNLVDSTRSVSNTIAIDSTEEYTLLSGTLAGVTDLLKEYRAQLSLYTGIPEVAFSSATVGGISNSSEGPLQMFWSATAREQKLRANRIVMKLVMMLRPELKTFTIEWLPLAEESPAAAADRLQKTAAADAAYITSGVLSVEEIRDTLGTRGDYRLGKNPPPPPRQPAPVTTSNPSTPAGGE
ncbi:portal protein [Pantoea phage vB_PagM_LIET2]|uniref:Portal protein n=1 Tax=Pantoea phage vB_PagM_LIET2 TaxID=2508071 RepID=A0A411AW18_9CAUD|nr:portal protein [Pantoea phage vB_PagM_LIET2]QAX92279.1 portal protein [Pantoea phage vB_PagM_LIET2]